MEIVLVAVHFGERSRIWAWFSHRNHYYIAINHSFAEAKYSRIDITNDLRIKYQNYLRPEIKTISISQFNEDVWLETLAITIIKEKGWT